MNTILAQLIIGGDKNGPAIDIQGPEQTEGGLIDLSNPNIGAIIGPALTLVFAAAGIGLLLMIISSGFSLMTSAGDPKKAAAGKSRLTNAIIGFILIFAAYWIVQILGVILGWESIGTIFNQ